MIHNITTGWTFRRVFYLIAGGGIMWMSVTDHQWFGAVMGGYFAAMGLFAFGCASGNCAGGVCATDDVQSSPDPIHHKPNP